MKSVVITGAAGFLGSHLSEYYLKQGYHVVGLDNLCTGSQSNVDLLLKLSPQFEFHELDACTAADEWPKAENVEFVFHFASPASPPLYQKLNIETLWVNTKGLESALKYADKHHARVIFASTSEVYGDPSVSPQPETYWGNVNSFGVRSCYDEAKRFGEALIFSHNERHKTSHGLVRIFNTYGPRMNPNDGRVVINFILQALRNEPLTVYGDGLQTRSFCYVTDLVEGISRYAQSMLTIPVNLGNQNEFTILELAEKVLQVTNSTSKIIYHPLPGDDPKQRRPDTSRAREKLNHWKPQVELLEGLTHMTKWCETQI